MVPGLVVTGLDFNQISIFTSHGLSSSVAASVFSVSSAVALASSLTGGWLVDRISPRYVLAAGQMTLAAAMAVILATDSAVWALAYGAVRGVTLGAWAVAIDATWPAYFGRGRLGSIRGMTFAAEILGASLGPLPFGLIYDASGSYTAAILGLLMLPFAATIAVLCATAPQQANSIPGGSVPSALSVDLPFK